MKLITVPLMVLAGLVVTSDTSATEPPRPNIVVLLADDIVIEITLDLGRLGQFGEVDLFAGRGELLLDALGLVGDAEPGLLDGDAGRDLH